jgi:hypothetical protein
LNWAGRQECSAWDGWESLEERVFVSSDFTKALLQNKLGPSFQYYRIKPLTVHQGEVNKNTAECAKGAEDGLTGT